MAIFLFITIQVQYIPLALHILEAFLLVRGLRYYGWEHRAVNVFSLSIYKRLRGTLHTEPTHPCNSLEVKNSQTCYAYDECLLATTSLSEEKHNRITYLGLIIMERELKEKMSTLSSVVSTTI